MMYSPMTFSREKFVSEANLEGHRCFSPRPSGSGNRNGDREGYPRNPASMVLSLVRRTAFRRELCVLESLRWNQLNLMGENCSHEFLCTLG